MDFLPFISKLLRLLISPDFLLVVFLFISFISYYHFRKLSRMLFAVVLFPMVALTFFPIGEWLIHPLETTYKTNPKIPDKLDGIIMLSGGEEPVLARLWQQIEFDKAVERNLYFLKFMRKYPDTRFYFSGGGKAEYQGYSKRLISQLAESWGLNVDQITFELNSTNTLQNIKNLHNLIKPTKEEKWLVITSAWHMPRAKNLFDRYNWEIIPFPVDHLSHKGNLFRIHINFSDNLETFKIGIKEWVGLLVYSFIH